MAKSTKKALAWQKAYNARPENVKKREANNRARYAAVKSGRARVGDGTQVDHKKPLRHGGSNTPGNLRVVKRSTNAAWRKGKKGYDR
jgi:hypothetical protein